MPCAAIVQPAAAAAIAQTYTHTPTSRRKAPRAHCQPSRERERYREKHLLFAAKFREIALHGRKVSSVLPSRSSSLSRSPLLTRHAVSSLSLSVSLTFAIPPLPVVVFFFFCRRRGGNWQFYRSDKWRFARN